MEKGNDDQKKQNMKNLITLFENAGVGLFIIKLPERKIIHANIKLAQILGYENLRSLFAGFTWQKHFPFIGMVKPDKTRIAEFQEMQILRSDKAIGWVNFSFGLFSKTGHLQGVLVDISDRKKLEAEIVRISDLEREKFGRDLHDILGQTLTGTAFICRALMRQLPKNAASLAESVGQIENQVNQALVQARHLSHGLVYTEVPSSGIGSRLKTLATQVNTIFGVNCKAECDSRVKFPNRESATHLYRIAQEALNNAIKHSNSLRFEIRLKKTADTGVLTVEDFGKGLSKSLLEGQGIGLRLMKLRAKLMGASIKFLNKKGSGFQVICIFPLVKEKNERKNCK